jgi:hypothetical protein
MIMLHVLGAIIILLTVPSGRKWRTIWSRYQAR